MWPLLDLYAIPAVEGDPGRRAMPSSGPPLSLGELGNLGDELGDRDPFRDGSPLASESGKKHPGRRVHWLGRAAPRSLTEPFFRWGTGQEATPMPIR